MPKRLLPPPPVVIQGEGYKCWAAALESWLKATPGRRQRDMEWLLSYSRKFRSVFEKDMAKMNKNFQMPEGAINAEMFKEMLKDSVLDFRMEFEEHPAGIMLADDHLYQTMAMHPGYHLIVYTPRGQGSNMTRHANVIFGAADDGSVMVMEPMRGTHMGKHKDAFGSPMLLAYPEAAINPWSDVVPLR